MGEATTWDKWYADAEKRLPKRYKSPGPAVLVGPTTEELEEHTRNSMAATIGWQTQAARSKSGRSILFRIIGGLPSFERKMVEEYLRDEGIQT